MSTIDDNDDDDAQVYQYPQKCTAADIPPELFELILYFLMLQVNVRSDEEDHLQVVDVSKRELSNCGLTCRYWADLCLSKTFERVKITSREELLELAELVRSPHSYLRRYLAIVDLVHADAKPPWIHHVLPLVNVLPLESSEKPQYTLVLEGPGFANLPKQPPLSIRSIHQSVPRRIPPSMSPFDMLHLSNVHFRSFNDLLRLVGELPILTQVILRGLSWMELPDAVPVVRGRSRLFYVAVSSVEAYWPFVRLFAGGKRDAHEIESFYTPSPMASPDYVVLDRLYRCIFAGVLNNTEEGTDVITEARLSCLKNPETQQTKIEGRVWAHEGPHYRRSFGWVHEKSLALTPDLHVFYEHLEPVPTQSNSTYAHITYLTIDLRGLGLSFEKAIDRDWVRFDEAASSLPFLRGVAIGVYLPRDIEEFSRQKGELFTNLKAKGLLRFGHRDIERTLWYSEGVDCSKTPDAGVNELWKIHLRHV